MVAELSLRNPPRRTRWLALAALAVVCFLPHPAQATPPKVAKGGREVLLQLAETLQQHAKASVAAVQADQAACDKARADGRGCPPLLRDSVARMIAVADGWLDVRQQLTARLAENPIPPEVRVACARRRDAAACARVRSEDETLDAFAALRIAPALDHLARLADQALRDLQLARAQDRANEAKLPQPAPSAPAPPPPPTLPAPPPEARVPPPPAAELNAACKRGSAQACLKVATTWESRGAFGEARTWYKLACRYGAKQACNKAK